MYIWLFDQHKRTGWSLNLSGLVRIVGHRTYGSTSATVHHHPFSIPTQDNIIFGESVWVQGLLCSHRQTHLRRDIPDNPRVLSGRGEGVRRRRRTMEGSSSQQSINIHIVLH